LPALQLELIREHPDLSHAAAQDLNDSMQSHLRLHFSNEEASDEQV
jgi:hypothetical protein